MSNRRPVSNPLQTNRRRLTNHARTVISAILLSGGVLSPGMIAWANGPAPGTVIENQATGSFVDPSDSSTKLIESNVVQVTVAEVAGITVTDNGYTEPNDGTVNDGETVYVDFVLTNVGNDPTQFVIPGVASITNGTQSGDIQIIEYDADGTGADVAEDLSGSNITVPGGGDNTGNLLNSVANTNNGSVPAGGSITVRVPVTAGTAGLDLTVTLGDTVATDGQNEVYVAGTNDVYTQDNTGTTNGDTDGSPINNEREAEDSLTVAIAASTPTTDYGDAPSAYGDASHANPGAPTVYLGSTIDGESATQLGGDAGAGADGDDTDGTDDDDGVIFSPALGFPNTVYVVQTGISNTVNVEASTAGTLSAWIDYNQDGDFADTGEQILINESLSAGTNALTFTPDNRILHGETYARFRFSTQSGLGPTGIATDGEVEDYSVYVAAPVSQVNACAMTGLLDGGFEQLDIGVTSGFVRSFGSPPTASRQYHDYEVPGWNFTGTNVPPLDDIEIWQSQHGGGSPGFDAYEGGQHAEINAEEFGLIFQDVVTTPGAVMSWQFAHRGRRGTDSMRLNIGAPDATTAQGTFTTGNDVNAPDQGWVIYSGSYTVPPNQYVTRLEFEATSTANGNITTGNFIDDVKFSLPPCVPSTVDISGNLYVDSNNNDIYEDTAGGGSEAALPENITVRLLSSDGTTELATTVTDTNGFYEFTNLTPGTYQVAVETTDPDIPTGLNNGTPTPLTVDVSGGNVSDQDFGFDLITSGAGVSFCQNPNGEVYSGGIANDIYGIYSPTGATFRITSSALAGVVNSLATDHVNRVVYYAEGQAIYAWNPINDTHVRLQDSSGNLNVSSMLGGGNISTLTSGGGAFYSGSLYLGIEQAQGNSDTDVYRVDFVPGSGGLTVQSLTAIGVNDNTGGANGGLDSANWGDMIISDTGIIYGATRAAGFFWSFDLNTGIYNQISNNYLGQLAKDGDGTLWGLSDTGRIQEVDVNTGSLFGPSSLTSSAIADMGECVIGFSTIGDRVWDDLDGDGVQDTLEPGIANVTIGLYRDLTGNGVIDGSDPLLTSQVTNASGNYDFVDLIPGTYIVRILEGTADDLDGNNILDGSVLTTTSTTPGGQQAVNLPLGIVDYDNADFGYQLPVIPQNPNVLLVKRITQINNSTDSAGGDSLSAYINQDDATNPYDDNDITVADPVAPTDPPKDTDQWPDPNTNLIGGIDGGNVMPNDEIEYTIYFLSSGDTTAESVLFCDYVPTFTSYIPNGYTGSAPQATGGIGGADLSIELFRNGITDYHTGANDGDSATYFGPGIDPSSSFPGIDCDGDKNGVNDNPNGAVVVNLGDLPDATTDATGAYGYVRFRARVR
ncbi:MAG: SdrD B-like domain-containing protein [Cyanobacteria bacterium J06656_5]